MWLAPIDVKAKFSFFLMHQPACFLPEDLQHRLLHSYIAAFVHLSTPVYLDNYSDLIYYSWQILLMQASPWDFLILSANLRSDSHNGWCPWRRMLRVPSAFWRVASRKVQKQVSKCTTVNLQITIIWMICCAALHNKLLDVDVISSGIE